MTAHSLLRLVGTKRFPSHMLQQRPKHSNAAAPMALAWNTLVSQYGGGAGCCYHQQQKQQHRWMSVDADMKHRNIGISAHIDR